MRPRGRRGEATGVRRRSVRASVPTRDEVPMMLTQRFTDALEYAIAHDYRGRIVYELLQNAEDAMADSPGSENAVIHPSDRQRPRCFTGARPGSRRAARDERDARTSQALARVWPAGVLRSRPPAPRDAPAALRDRVGWFGVSARLPPPRQPRPRCDQEPDARSSTPTSLSPLPRNVSNRARGFCTIRS